MFGMQRHPLQQQVIQNHAEESMYHESCAVYCDTGSRHIGQKVPVFALCYDRYEELLWAGNQTGHVTSYYSSMPERFSSFQVHNGNDIRQLISLDGGIGSLTKNNLRISYRGGLKIYDISSPQLTNLTCVCASEHHNTLILAGAQSSMSEYDINTASLIRMVDVPEPGISMMRQSGSTLFCADSRGKLHLRDLATLKSEHFVDCHSAGISDFDIEGHQLITCGLSHRMGQMIPDHLLKSFDLRFLRPLTPLQVVVEPAFVRFLPTYVIRLVVIGRNGAFQIIDPSGVINSNSFVVHKLNLAAGESVTSFDSSSSCQSLSFGDSAGIVHLWNDRENAIINFYSRQSAFPDPTAALPMIDMDQQTPLSLIAMPTPASYGNVPLLSDMPNSLTKFEHRSPAPLDPSLLEQMKVVGFVGYAPNPNNLVQNVYREVANPVVKKEENTKLDMAERMKRTCKVVNMDYHNATVHLYKRFSISLMPGFGPKVNLFNKTNFPGVCTSTESNVYSNLLQLLFFIDPIQMVIRAHSCADASCIVCEFCYVYQTLYIVKKDTVEFDRLGELLSALISKKCGKDISKMLVAKEIPFLIEKVMAILAPRLKDDHKVPLLSRVFEWSMEGACDAGHTIDEAPKRILKMTYPANRDEVIPFTSLLQTTLDTRHTRDGKCQGCGKKKNVKIHSSKQMGVAPDIMLFDCDMFSPGILQFWKHQHHSMSHSDVKTKSGAKSCRYGDACSRGDCKFSHPKDETTVTKIPWLPLSFAYNKSLRRVRDIEKPMISLLEDDEDLYILYAVVAAVTDDQGNIVNEICHQFIGQYYHKKKEGVSCSGWYLFNGPCVSPLEEQQANVFDLEWCQPIMVSYAKYDYNSDYDFHIRPEFTFKMAFPGEKPNVIPLVIDEILNAKPQLKAILAFSFKEGTTEPKEEELSVARYSEANQLTSMVFMRANGPKAGTAFIDEEGDLNPGHVYWKMRYLVDYGVTFIGANLTDELARVCIHTYKDQCQEIASLYKLAKFQTDPPFDFLAWYFIGEKEFPDSRALAKLVWKLCEKHVAIKAERETYPGVIKRFMEKGEDMRHQVP